MDTYSAGYPTVVVVVHPTMPRARTADPTLARSGTRIVAPPICYGVTAVTNPPTDNTILLYNRHCSVMQQSILPARNERRSLQYADQLGPSRRRATQSE